MKKYIVNIIAGGNLKIPVSAKDEDSACEKVVKKYKREDFIKLFKKYGELVDFELTTVEEELNEKI